MGSAMLLSRAFAGNWRRPVTRTAMADTLAALVTELEAMAPGARRSILRSLSADERALLVARLDAAAVGTDAPAEERFSPWLAAAVHAARSDAADTRMTSASRQALMRSADAIMGVVPTRTATTPGGGRSLFDTVNGLLSPRRLRP